MNTLGVIIGRFQVEALSTGHFQLIDKALQHHDNILILVGVKNSPRTATNPLPFISVSHIIKEKLLDYLDRITIIPLIDEHYDNIWSKKVDDIISSMADDAILYYSRDSFVDHYKGKYTTQSVASVNEKSGTRRREEIGKIIQNNSDWREGVIWSMENLPHRTYHTVDIAVINKQNASSKLDYTILLVQKPNERLWRLPGGFVEPNELFIDAAKRELQEETGLVCESKPSHLGDFIIEDWRIRKAKNVSHKTILFMAEYSWGAPVAADDIARVRWQRISALNKSIIVEEHKPLIQTVCNNLEIRLLYDK